MAVMEPTYSRLVLSFILLRQIFYAHEACGNTESSMDAIEKIACKN